MRSKYLAQYYDSQGNLIVAQFLGNATTLPIAFAVAERLQSIVALDLATFKIEENQGTEHQENWVTVWEWGNLPPVSADNQRFCVYKETLD
ncbi:hypothetical protein ACQ4M3_37285 [Leptolyngbya sp. AN03gr2]|uniref:hypothetical protein n=1 Tax=unclassified Leptolyngbya TaxID=2650499 RepID=UPI003D312508